MENYTLMNSIRSFRYAQINAVLISVFILLNLFKPEGANRTYSLLFGVIFCVLSTLSFSGMYFYHRGTDEFTSWKRRFSFFIHICICLLILFWFLAACAYILKIIK
jgi:hypothetical protein